MEDKYFVFVYGTLMRGERAHGFLSGAEFVGEYMLPDYAIYDLGRYPGVKPKRGAIVYGEVYKVGADMIKSMDEYEEEGSLYYRRELTVMNEASKVSAFVYVYEREAPDTEIESGSWKKR